ncbi:MAG TPA: hypothetical protein VK934_01610 [Fimbriimonas sp.]|nr:hypothetical protein [Fimbriimonas sp.]
MNIIRSFSRLLVLVTALSTLALTAQAQSLSIWGNDWYGQLSSIPSGPFTSMSFGYGHCVALRPDGTIVSWGLDYVGEVSNTPSGTFTAVAAGYDFSIALRTDGTLVSWGINDLGQVSQTPSGTFKAIAAGENHGLAIRTDGTLATWGRSDNGLPNVPSGTFISITGGGFHSAAVRSDGQLFVWGWNGYGQISNAPSGTFKAVAAGYHHNVALRTDGTLACWGINGPQLWDTPITDTYTSIAAGYYSSMALDSDGNVHTWGYDDDGQVTNSPTSGRFFAIAIGPYNAMALAYDTCVPFSFTLDPDQVIGGNGTTGTVTMTIPAPAGGTVVRVRCNLPGYTTQSKTIIIPEGETVGYIPIGTDAVASNTQVSMFVTANAVALKSRLILWAPQILGLTIPSWVQGPAIVTATLTLSDPAPVGGLPIDLTSSLPSVASVPASIVVPEGATTVDFTVTCYAASKSQTVKIRAAHKGSGAGLAYIKVVR